MRGNPPRLEGVALGALAVNPANILVSFHFSTQATRDTLRADGTSIFDKKALQIFDDARLQWEFLPDNVNELIAMAKKEPGKLAFASSGAGASTQSTCPESSAAVRAFASGIGKSTILSTLGTRALSQ